MWITIGIVVVLLVIIGLIFSSSDDTLGEGETEDFDDLPEDEIKEPKFVVTQYDGQGKIIGEWETEMTRQDHGYTFFEDIKNGKQIEICGTIQITEI